jgi:hypothetical protein
MNAVRTTLKAQGERPETACRLYRLFCERTGAGMNLLARKRGFAYQAAASIRGVRYPLLGIALLLCSAIAAEKFTAEPSPEDAPPTEYELKAAFLYNFAKFVEWPAQAFANPQAPFVVGILGQNPFERELERTVQNKTINGRPFEIKEFRVVSEVKSCHILFISSSERKRLPEVLRTVRGMSILTVSELDRFLQAGGMIQFIMEGKKVRFEINDEAARKAELRISSKLLSVARRTAPEKAP